MKKDDWNAVLETNLTGAFRAIQQVLQGMMRERWGRIINITSVVGQAGNAGQAQLRRIESGADRTDEIDGAGNGEPQCDGERRRAGFHRDGHDEQAFGGDQSQGAWRRFRCGGMGNGRRRSRGRPVSGER